MPRSRSERRWASGADGAVRPADRQDDRQLRDVVPVDPVSVPPVRSQVGAVWSEATATPVSIKLTTGAIAGDDPRTITCKPWGSITEPADGCTWTPRYPSVPKVTGTEDLKLHGTISIIWDVNWTSSSGAGGSLGQLSTTTPIEITVMEIQVY